MQDCRSNQEHAPLKTDHLVDNNKRCVLFAKHLLSFIGYITRKCGEGHHKYKIEDPGQPGKGQIYRYADNRAGSARSKRDKPAAETGGNKLDYAVDQKGTSSWTTYATGLYFRQQQYLLFITLSTALKDVLSSFY